MDTRLDLRFGGCGRACGCCVLGGREEFCGFQSHSVFEFPDPVQQRLHEGSHRRSHLGIEFRWNCERLWLGGRHGACRLTILRSCPDQFAEKQTPGCERLPLVHTWGSNYYLDLTLDGGTGDLFRYWNGANPVPEPGEACRAGVGTCGRPALPRALDFAEEAKLPPEISPEVSNSSGSNSNGYPDVSTRTISTTVRLNDGETITLGDSLKTRNPRDLKKFPFSAIFPCLANCSGQTRKTVKKQTLSSTSRRILSVKITRSTSTAPCMSSTSTTAMPWKEKYAPLFPKRLRRGNRSPTRPRTLRAHPPRKPIPQQSMRKERIAPR